LRITWTAQLIACCLTVVAFRQAGLIVAQGSKIQGLITARNGAAMTVGTATGRRCPLTAADRTAALKMTKELP
jgi:hypothetical protein